jgi:uncharacterized coiled-coil DUF342 family protein
LKLGENLMAQSALEQRATDGVEAIRQIVTERDALRLQCTEQERLINRLQAVNDTIERQHNQLVAERDHYMKQTMLLMNQINNVASIINQARDESRSIVRDIVGPRGQSPEDLTRELEKEMPKFIESLRSSNGASRHDEY